MKKIFSLLLCLPLLTLTGCKGADETDKVTDTQASAETVPAETETPAVDPSSIGEVSSEYATSAGSLLRSYAEQNEERYRGVCSHYSATHTLYRESEMAGNLSSTFTNGGEVVHVYYVKALKELNIVTDNKSSLPPAQPEAITGEYKTSVTQLKSVEINGMGYVILLADGTFIVYDGGYATLADELWSTLVSLKGGEDGIHIRMWLLTHAHSDHYPCFGEFGKKYGERVTVDYVTISTVAETDTETYAGGKYYLRDFYSDLKLFSDAKLCLAHTGMVFRLCNVTLEILCSADEIFIDYNPGNMNDASIVSRVYNSDGSVLFLGDAAYSEGSRLIMLYGDYLKSDICQIAHHGVEDFPLAAYQLIDAPILFYPCSTSLYNLTDRDANVRKYLKESDSTKEILIQDTDRHTRYFGK